MSLHGRLPGGLGGHGAFKVHHRGVLLAEENTMVEKTSDRGLSVESGIRCLRVRINPNWIYLTPEISQPLVQPPAVPRTVM